MKSDLEMSCLKHPRRELQVTPIVQKKKKKKQPDQRQELEDLRYMCRKQRLVIAIMTVMVYVSFAGMLLMALH